MKPEVGKWYWVSYHNSEVAHIVRCEYVNETHVIVKERFGKSWRFPIEWIVGEYTPPRRWWRAWRRKR